MTRAPCCSNNVDLHLHLTCVLALTSPTEFVWLSAGMSLIYFMSLIYLFPFLFALSNEKATTVTRAPCCSNNVDLHLPLTCVLALTSPTEFVWLSADMSANLFYFFPQIFHYLLLYTSLIRKSSCIFFLLLHNFLGFILHHILIYFYTTYLLTYLPLKEFFHCKRIFVVSWKNQNRIWK